MKRLDWINMKHNENTNKIATTLEVFRKYSSLIISGISIITTLIIIVTYFVTTNVRLTQIANAEVQLEQSDKDNTDQHKNFVTHAELQTSLESIKEITTQTNTTVRNTNLLVNQLLQRK